MPLIPSRTTDRFWIQAWAKGHDEEVGAHVGKWVVEVDKERLDSSWAVICESLACGELGPAAKARTALPHPVFESARETVICVYTRDSRDLEDRHRVRRRLETLGFRRLRYMTDEESIREWRRLALAPG